MAFTEFYMNENVLENTKIVDKTKLKSFLTEYFPHSIFIFII